MVIGRGIGAMEAGNGGGEVVEKGGGEDGGGGACSRLGWGWRGEGGGVRTVGGLSMLLFFAWSRASAVGSTGWLLMFVALLRRRGRIGAVAGCAGGLGSQWYGEYEGV